MPKRKLAPKAQSEAPSVDRLDKILYEYVMWRDNYYQDLEAGVLTEKEWINIRDKVQSEAKAKINRLITEAELRGFNVAFDCHDYDRLREYKQTLSNNLSKGDDNASS